MMNLSKFKKRENIEILVVGAAYLILLVRLLWFVDQNAVNILFWDQWDFLTPLFNESKNLWGIYSHQHGPHRQGLGGLLMAVIYPLSDWNVRVEVFTSVGIMAFSCWMALLIKKRLWGKYSWTDIFIPMAFFTLLQFEIFIATPNLSHGSLPVFLVTLTAFLLTFENQIIRALGLASVVFLSTYTGFAIFSGILVMFLMVIFSVKSSTTKIRFWNIAALAMSLIFFLSFFLHYQFMPAVDCFQFPHPRPFEYLEFSVAQFGCAWGIWNVSAYPQTLLLKQIITYSLFITILLIAAFFAFQTIRTQDKKSVVIFYLSSFTIIFIFFTAIGRVCLGIEVSHASRYIPYTIPGMLALYFTFLIIGKLPEIPARIKTLLMLTLFMLMTFREVVTIRNTDAVNHYRDAKINWSKCYLENNDINYCNEKVSFQVYPNNDRIKDKLEYLKVRKLNFFKENKKKL